MVEWSEKKMMHEEEMEQRWKNEMKDRNHSLLWPGGNLLDYDNNVHATIPFPCQIEDIWNIANYITDPTENIFTYAETKFRYLLSSIVNISFHFFIVHI